MNKCWEELQGDVMKLGNFDLLEEYIVQHPDMMELSDSGINTACSA